MNNDGILTEGRRTAVLVILAASLVIVVLATLAGLVGRYRLGHDGHLDGAGASKGQGGSSP